MLAFMLALMEGGIMKHQEMDEYLAIRDVYWLIAKTMQERLEHPTKWEQFTANLISCVLLVALVWGTLWMIGYPSWGNVIYGLLAFWACLAFTLTAWTVWKFEREIAWPPLRLTLYQVKRCAVGIRQCVYQGKCPNNNPRTWWHITRNRWVLGCTRRLGWRFLRIYVPAFEWAVFSFRIGFAVAYIYVNWYFLPAIRLLEKRGVKYLDPDKQK
jgi:hypothetical protein